MEDGLALIVFGLCWGNSWHGNRVLSNLEMVQNVWAGAMAFFHEMTKGQVEGDAGGGCGGVPILSRSLTLCVL